MNRKLVYSLLGAMLAAVAVLAAFSVPASAQKRTIYVKLATGQVVPVTVDVPTGTPLDRIPLPGAPVAPGTPSQPNPAPGAPNAPNKQPTPTPGSPTTGRGERQAPSTDRRKPRKRQGKGQEEDPGSVGDGKGEPGKKRQRTERSKTELRNTDGSPTASNPGFVDALPGPSFKSGVPNFVIRKFRVPIFLLPIYQSAGIQYGVRWEILAAINEIETDYGRNLNVSSAGALGWMQFIPSSWKMYGVDGNKDGKKDPYNPVDAIFAAARYLKAAGYEKSARRSIFAYNHADWYVDSVMLRARLISGVPADLVGSLTGLTEGRFPVAAHARYADDLKEAEATKRVKRGQNAASVVSGDDGRKGIEIFSERGAPAIATNDGVVKRIGTSKRLGRYVTLQDAYGNSYTYGRLGSVARSYAVPKDDADPSDPKDSAKALKANAKDDTKPSAPASAGRQPGGPDPRPKPKVKLKGKAKRKGGTDAATDAPKASVPVKKRLFAHPDLPSARQAGGLDQQLDNKARKGSGVETYKNLTKPLGLDTKDVRLKRLKPGARVTGGTVLGRVGKSSTKGAHLYFEIRPAGKGAPRIDPKPILDGWKLLEATSIYRASGKNVLYGDDSGGGFSVGQVLLLPKPLLQKRVLSDARVDVYPCGRKDIQSGQVDRRVLATLEYLAESGMRPTVTSMKCGHGNLTASGNVSEHSSGNAVDIAKINGIPILGHQDKGGITEQAVRRLMRLQGTMTPHQIISLLDMGNNTLAMGDHADHIHVGFQPLFGDNKKLGKQAFQVLKPGQWSDLLNRLRKIDNPVVPTKPSKYAIPTDKRASEAHKGE